MSKQINPYSIVPIFDGGITPSFFLPSPVASIIPWQFWVNEDVTTYSWSLQSLDTPAEYDQGTNGLEISKTTDGKTYITYKGDALAVPVPAGNYQIEIFLDGTKYVSGGLCLSDLFDPNYATLEVVSCRKGAIQPGQVGSPDDDATFRFRINTLQSSGYGIDRWDGAAWVAMTINVRNEAVFNWINPNDNQDVELKFRTNVNGTFVEYTMKFKPDAPCNYVFWTTNYFAASKKKPYYIEFGNTKDLQGVLYQTGYKQRYYFIPEFEPIGTISNPTFVQDGENNRYLESSSIAELQAFEFHPVPDWLVLALKNIENMDHKILISTIAITGEELTNFEFTPRVVRDDIHSVGRVTYERGRSFIGCPENMQLQ